MARSLRNRWIAGCMASGGGTTFATAQREILAGRLQGIRFGIVIASKPTAGIIAKAKALEISEGDILVINPKDFPSNEAYGREIIVESKKRGVMSLHQMGHMPLTPKNVIQEFLMTNQHPGALDPSRRLENESRDFGGKGMRGAAAVAAALFFFQETGRSVLEASIQRVHPELDRGALNRTWPIEIEEGDTVDRLQEVMLPFEHLLTVEMLREIAVYGTLNVFERSRPLISYEEMPALRRAKAKALELYPKG